LASTLFFADRLRGMGDGRIVFPMNRRNFLYTSLAATLALQTRNLFALEGGATYRDNIGIQLYTLRNELKADTAATLKAVADAGYKQVEPFGFPDADALIKGSQDVGLKINSTHFQWESATKPKDDSFSDFLKIVDKAKGLGLSHLVVPYLHDGDRRTLDDYKRVAGNLNKAAAKAKEAGIQLCYHNHSFEFKPLEGGKSGFDVFAEEFSKDMKFELDLFWVKLGGIEPTDLIAKLAGRVEQLHLKDLKEGIKTPEFGSVPKDAFKELGNGIIKTEPILVAAEKAGIKHCHVEQDQSPDALASIKQSIAYLKTL
jgi:sugar phosphate isomerase/epimerase